MGISRCNINKEVSKTRVKDPSRQNPLTITKRILQTGIAYAIMPVGKEKLWIHVIQPKRTPQCCSTGVFYSFS